MKLICSTEGLSKALNSVLRTVGTRAGIPALAGVLVELSDSDLTLTTTDLELTTEVRLGVSGEAGSVVVPAKYFSEIVKNLPADEVELTTEGGTLKVSGGRARYNLRTLPAEDFPKPPAPETSSVFAVDAKKFGAALAKTVTAASRDETRPVLTGVLFESDGAKLTLVATDSFRMAVTHVASGAEAGMKILVPSRAVGEVIRLCATENTIEIELSAGQASFKCDSTVLRSRLIDGEFPAYRDVIPTDQPIKATIAKAEFTDRLRAVAVLATDATAIDCMFETDVLKMVCTSQGIGDATEEVDAQLTGESIEMRFNPSYLEAALAGIDGDTVEIAMTEAQRPVVVGAAGEDYTYLIMPIRSRT